MAARRFRQTLTLAIALTTIASSAQAVDRVIVVTATAGFRHEEAIETAESVIAEIASRSRLFEPFFARTEEEAVQALSTASLRNARLVMFVNTTGEIATASRPALLQWVSSGGAFIGVHAAADTWHESPEYIEMLGGEFDRHPDETTVDVFIDDASHAATAELQSPHRIFEEIYFFKNFSAAGVSMLMSLRADPESGNPGFFPLAWHREHGRGRVLYTALGHRSETWLSPWFQQHLTGAIAWGLRRDAAHRRRAVTR
jgi:type 1 glutamine amidotransferase